MSKIRFLHKKLKFFLNYCCQSLTFMKIGWFDIIPSCKEEIFEVHRIYFNYRVFSKLTSGLLVPSRSKCKREITNTNNSASCSTVFSVQKMFIQKEKMRKFRKKNLEINLISSSPLKVRENAKFHILLFSKQSQNLALFKTTQNSQLSKFL